MRRIIIITILLFGAHVSPAQVLGEIFNQAKKQKKYLLEQIAALQVYIKAVQKGYDIAKDGLNLISDIKNKDLSLHKDYFASLKKVNRVVKDDPRTGQIIARYYEIVTVCHQSKREVKETGMLTQAEYSYYAGVLDKLESASTYLMQELGTVTTADQWTMKDDERLDRIGNLLIEMQDNYTFCKSFTGQALVMAVSRKNEMISTKTLRALHGID